MIQDVRFKRPVGEHAPRPKRLWPDATPSPAGQWWLRAVCSKSDTPYPGPTPFSFLRLSWRIGCQPCSVHTCSCSPSSSFTSTMSLILLLPSHQPLIANGWTPMGESGSLRNTCTDGCVPGEKQTMPSVHNPFSHGGLCRLAAETWHSRARPPSPIFVLVAIYLSKSRDGPNSGSGGLRGPTAATHHARRRNYENRLYAS